jgi:spermidine synthase
VPAGAAAGLAHTSRAAVLDRWLLAILSPLFFCSGAAGLIYQVLWARLLGLTFGVTVYAVSAVLGGFMAGLALGSWLGGHYASRLRRPLAVYGVLELAIGLIGATTPWLLSNLPLLYRSVYGSLAEDYALLTLVRLAAALTLLVPPTALMGATLPVVVRSSLGSTVLAGRAIALLYAVNTLGAMAGAFWTTFYGVGLFGIDGAILVAAGLNILAGLLALLLSWLGAGHARPGSAGISAEDHHTVGGRQAPAPAVVTAVFWVMGLSGLCSLAYEVVWTRLLALYNTTVYAFGLMLALVLFGIAVGSYLTSPFLGRRWNWPAIFAALQCGIGLTVLGGLALLEHKASLVGWLATHPALYPLVASSTRSFAFTATALILPASLLMGLSFPIGTHIYAAAAPQPGAVAWRLGNVYALNVCGAIAGSLLAGFVLIPWLGSQRAAVLLAALSMLGGLSVAVLAAPPLLLGARHGRQPSPTAASHSRRGMGALYALALLLVCAVALTVSLRQRELVLTVYRDLVPDGQVLWFEEGVETTVVTLRAPSGNRVMYINHQHQADDGGSAPYHRLLGHLPAILAREPRRALVIGLGGGSTAGALAQHRMTVDVVELSDSVVRGAALFRHVNYNVLVQPNVYLRVDDGRNYLLLTNRRYDVIVADITRPIYAGSGNLYSVEYLRLARDALTDGGVMLHWLWHELPDQQYRLIMRTFLEAFPYATLWADGTLLIGSRTPQAVTPSELQQRLARLPGQAALRDIDLTTAEQVLNLFTADRTEMARFVGDGPVLTDMRPYLEYYRSLGGDRTPADRSHFSRDPRRLARS